jgi:hypothetical protein
MITSSVHLIDSISTSVLSGPFKLINIKHSLTTDRFGAMASIILSTLLSLDSYSSSFKIPNRGKNWNWALKGLTVLKVKVFSTWYLIVEDLALILWYKT